jgi:hypothetical protein
MHKVPLHRGGRIDPSYILCTIESPSDTRHLVGMHTHVDSVREGGERKGMLFSRNRFGRNTQLKEVI